LGERNHKASAAPTAAAKRNTADHTKPSQPNEEATATKRCTRRAPPAALLAPLMLPMWRDDLLAKTMCNSQASQTDTLASRGLYIRHHAQAPCQADSTLERAALVPGSTYVQPCGGKCRLPCRGVLRPLPPSLPGGSASPPSPSPGVHVMTHLTFAPSSAVLPRRWCHDFLDRTATLIIRRGRRRRCSSPQQQQQQQQVSTTQHQQQPGSMLASQRPQRHTAEPPSAVVNVLALPVTRQLLRCRAQLSPFQRASPTG
jgi:hypothetical protein